MVLNRNLTVLKKSSMYTITLGIKEYQSLIFDLNSQLCIKSSVESQKGTITIQGCSVEKQKGAIAIDFVQR